MSSQTPSKARLWAGRVVSALPVLMLFFSASMKLAQSKEVVEGFVEKGGWPAGALLPIGVVEILCTVIYLVPQTAVLGAVLLTGYLGGAVATHIHGGDPAGRVMIPILLGVFVWLGLFLRHPRLGDLLPFRKPDAG
jgi:hypothetical protein